MKKLNLACGPVYLDGYINIDNKSHFPDIKVDMNADVFDLEFEENSIDEIVNAELQRKLANNETISGSKEDIVMAANIKLAAERNAEAQQQQA